MKITNLSIVITTGVCVMVLAGMLVSAAPWLARENIFEFTSREPKKRDPAEPDASPNGDPARQLGDSGVVEGPPAVS